MKLSIKKNYNKYESTEFFKMKKRYKKVIYIFTTIILFSIIGGIVKYSYRYIDENPDKYIPKTKQIII